MLRRHLGGSGARRLTLIALVAVVVGAGLWLVTADDESPKTTRLEATQSSIDPLLGQGHVGPWDTAGAATPGPPAPAPLPQAGPSTEPGGTESATGAPGAAASSAGAPAAAGGAIGRADSVDGGVGGGAGSESAPEPTSARGTGAATSSAELSGGTTSAPSAPSAGESPTTTEQPTTTSTPTQATTTTTAPAAAPSAGRSRNGAAEAEVVPLTNRDRAAAGLGTLSRNSCLDAAASGFAEQMAGSGVLAHNSGAGAAVRSCRPGAAWGDNVGTARPCDTALLEEEWMDSPSHRRNILTGEFRLIGVGAWTDDKGACWVQVLFSS